MKKLESPVSGRVASIVAKAGEAVSAGSIVATIESMKMEIPVESEEAGVVARVVVTVGQEIEEGDTLFELE